MTELFTVIPIRVSNNMLMLRTSLGVGELSTEQAEAKIEGRNQPRRSGGSVWRLSHLVSVSMDSITSYK
jgi:hypothetical protein